MFIMRVLKSALGFKAFKDCFTLLLGANLMGDCKLKPALVYHAENPHALKGYNRPACLSIGTPIPLVGWWETFSRHTAGLPWCKS